MHVVDGDNEPRVQDLRIAERLGKDCDIRALRITAPPWGDDNPGKSAARVVDYLIVVATIGRILTSLLVLPAPAIVVRSQRS